MSGVCKQVDAPNIKLTGIELPGPIWVKLNRMQADQGKCNYMLRN